MILLEFDVEFEEVGWDGDLDLAIGGLRGWNGVYYERCGSCWNLDCLQGMVGGTKKKGLATCQENI